MPYERMPSKTAQPEPASRPHHVHRWRRKYRHLLIPLAGILFGLGARLSSGLENLTYSLFGLALIVLLTPVILRCLAMIREIPRRASLLRKAEYPTPDRKGQITAVDILKNEIRPDLIRSGYDILGIASVGSGILLGWYIAALISAHYGSNLRLSISEAHLTEFQIILWLFMYQFWMLSKVAMILTMLACALVGSGIGMRGSAARACSVIVTILLVILSRELALRIVEPVFGLPEWYRDQFFYFLFSPGWDDFRVSLSFAVLEVGFIGCATWVTFRAGVRAVRQRTSKL